MTIYEDYTSWKEENSSLIQELIKLKSPIITRIIHVLAVIDYLNNQYYNQGGLDNDSEVIFETGFDYITNHFITISTILQKEFRGNLIQMNQIAKTINLLLYTNDFQKELEYSDDYSESDKEKLNDFEQKVLNLKLTGLSYTDIAKILGRDEKSTDNALSRIKVKVRKILDRK